MDNVIVDKSNYRVVQVDQGVLMTDDGKIYLQKISDGTVIIVEINEDLIREFNIPGFSAECTSSEPQSEVEEISRKAKKLKWTDSAIHLLIDLRINMDSEFKSITSRKEIIWKKLADKMNKQNFSCTSTQCHDKWRYLKSKYAAKKDNMSARQSGSERIDFKYFEEMDSFLVKKHNIEPIAVASSTRGNTIVTDDEESSSETTSIAKKRTMTTVLKKVKKKNSIEQLANKIDATAASREKNRERRHREILEARQKAVEVFATKMDELIKKM